MTRNNTLTEGPITSTLLQFSIPFLLATLLQSLYGTADTLTLGKFGTTAGLSAVSTSAQILGMVTFFAIGLSSGATVLLGQSIGAKDEKRAARILGNAIVDFGILSVFLTIVVMMIYPFMLQALNLPAEAMEEAYRYMNICTLGIPMIIGYNIVCAILRAIGDSKSPLLFVFVAAIINILGDIILTGFLGMGARGVAIATVASQGFSFLFSLYFILKKGLAFPFSRKEIRADADTTLHILKVGVPMALQSILINMSFMFITSIINGMGLTASASMGVGDKIINFAFLPQSSFSSALAVIVAQNIGARQPERALKSVQAAVYIGLGVQVFFVIICQFFPNLLPAIFTNDPEVIQMAGLYMRAYSIDGIFTAITFCLGGFMNGIGKTGFNMVQNLISTFLFRVPFTYILAHLPKTNLFLIGLACPISTIVTLLILGIYISKGFWKKDLYAHL